MESQDRIAAITRLGFTERQARFLVLVMQYSGVCLLRQYTAFAGAESEQSGNCHFAGEHTSQDFQGYLNGAVETGERAVAEVLADLK